MDAIRVSTVIHFLHPKALDFVRQEHLDRGSYHHESMEIYCKNAMYGYGQGEIDDAIRPVVDWVEREGVAFQAVEERIFNADYGYTGKPDALGTWKGKEVWFDWKFSEGLNAQNKMQGTVYTKMTGRPGVFVQCKRDGVVKVVASKPDPRAWAIFLAGLTVLKFHQEQGIIL